MFALTDPKAAFLAAHGFWHLQLWHTDAQVSVLTRSLLTSGRYEIFPIATWKQWAADHDELETLLAYHHDIVPPSAGTLAALEAWFVDEMVARLAS